MSYYDLDAILTDAEKIPCTFTLDVPELGYLDNNPDESLRAGTQLQLPLWLAEMLAISSTGGTTTKDSQTAGGSDNNNNAPVTLQLPAALAPEVLQALKADPRAVPLRERSHHFYSVGTRMLDLFEDRELADILRRSLVRRAAVAGLHARRLGEGHHHSGSAGQDGGTGSATTAKGGGGGGSAAAALKSTKSGGAASAAGLLGNEEFLRGLDEWERSLFRSAHEGARGVKDWMNQVKRS